MLLFVVVVKMCLLLLLQKGVTKRCELRRRVRSRSAVCLLLYCLTSCKLFWSSSHASVRLHLYLVLRVVVVVCYQLLL